MQTNFDPLGDTEIVTSEDEREYFVVVSAETNIRVSRALASVEAGERWLEHYSHEYRLPLKVVRVQQTVSRRVEDV